MPAVEERTHIACPPEEVHAFIRDIERYPEWIAFTDEVVEIDRVEGRIGTRYAEQGTGGESHWEVVACQRGRYEAHEGDIGIAKVRVEMTMEPADDGTDYHHLIEYEMKLPVVGWLLDKLVLGRSMREGLAETVANLKRILEAGPDPEA